MEELNRAVRLRNVRETLGLSQREFAQELGVAPSALAQWETEKRAPPGPIVRLLSLYEEQLRIGPLNEARPSRPPRAIGTWATRTASTAYAGALWAVLRKTSDSSASSFERNVRNVAIDHYVRVLGDLKGLGLKLGQLLANIDAIDPSLAEDGRQPIRASALQATPMPPHAVLSVFLSELKRTPRELFAEWSNKPLCAASIGQVHRATLHSGERVAVKVQYAEMAATLESDLRNVKLLDRLLCAINPAQRPGTYYDELSERFREECDYTREAESMREFARVLAERRDIRIPKVFGALSTRHILTTEFAEGQTLDDFAKSADSGARDRAGQAIWDFFYGCAAEEGFFHADPHAGNLLFDERGVTFLDFGRIGRMSPEFTEQYRLLARAVIEKDRPRAVSMLAQMDFARSLEAADNDDLYRVVLSTQMPWLLPGRFSFTSEFARNAWQRFAAPGLRPVLNVPRDTVLWSQLLFGVYALLVPLRCTVDCRDSALRRFYRPGERRPDPYTTEELARLGVLPS